MGDKALYDYLVVFVLITINFNCMMDTTAEEYSEDTTSSFETDIIQPRAGPGMDDYSYYNAVDICHTYNRYSSIISRGTNYLENTSDSEVFISCAIPAIYYNMIGYSSDELTQFVAYGVVPEYDDFIGVELEGETTTTTYPSDHGSCSIPFNGINMSSCVIYPNPAFSWNEAFVEASLSVSPGSKIYNFRIHHDE